MTTDDAISVCERRHTLVDTVVLLSFLLERRSEKIVCKLFKDKSEKYILRFYFNVDAALKTPVFECEVCPKVNENVLKILDEFASEYKPSETERKEE